jgi:hypothetical protein
VVDVAQGTLEAVNAQTKDGFRGWHAINIGTGVATSAQDLVQAFTDVSG